MAEDFHHDALIDVLGQEQGSRRYAGRHAAGHRDPSRLEQRFPFAPVGARIDRLAGGLALLQITWSGDATSLASPWRLGRPARRGKRYAGTVGTSSLGRPDSEQRRERAPDQCRSLL